MAGGKLEPALMPFTVGVLAGLVIYLRTRVVAIQDISRTRAAATRGARETLAA
jgi:hypothetical protein